MEIICDSSVFFTDIRPKGTLLTTSSVIGELIDTRSLCRLEVLISQGLEIRNPEKEFLQVVEKAALTSGDSTVLSDTDRDVLALALMTGGAVCTDDFALQNVALHLNLTTIPIMQRRAKKKIWHYTCTGCGAKADSIGTCLICGHTVRRTLK